MKLDEKLITRRDLRRIGKRYRMKANIPPMSPQVEHPPVPLDTSQFNAYEDVELMIDQIVESKKRHFRASIYVDIFVNETDQLEADREVANDIAKEAAQDIPNAFVGGVALWQPREKNQLDREL